MEVLHGKFIRGIIIYKYYIPERAIDRNVTLKNMIINRGKAVTRPKIDILRTRNFVSIFVRYKMILIAFSGNF